VPIPAGKPMTIIEIKLHRWGWKAFEAPGVEPVDSSYLKPFVISSRQSNKREYYLTRFPLRRRES
jgi:hypothetical protein